MIVFSLEFLIFFVVRFERKMAKNVFFVIFFQICDF